MTTPYTHPPMKLEKRTEFGRNWFRYTMYKEPPQPNCAYYYNGIANFVFGEMWSRPGLDMRSRRWITLTCVGAADATGPIRAHVYAALKSGDITIEEIREFVLHFAVYLGWPKASVMQQTIDEQWALIQSEGGPTPGVKPEPADYAG